MDLNLSKISKFLVVVILMLGPVTGSAQEVGGYAVKSKEHAAQVEEFAKCVGYFRVAKDNAFELQLEFDEEEFSDEAIQTFFDNVRSFEKYPLQQKLIYLRNIVLTCSKNVTMDLISVGDLQM